MSKLFAIPGSNWRSILVTTHDNNKTTPNFTPLLFIQCLIDTATC